MLLDWVGSQEIDDELLETMHSAGVELQLYRPLRWYHLARMNNRTHRKLLVVDGEIGFTGGVGIADKWAGDAHDPEHWREIAFPCRGSRRRANAGDVSRQLDEGHRRRAARRGLPARTRAGR